MLHIPVKLIYVCGPLSAPTPEGIEENVERALDAGRRVWELGAMAIIPHLNSPSAKFHGVMTAEMIYLADLELLDRCDAMYRLPGWRNSYGSKLETAWANLRQIRVFDDFDELGKYLQGHFSKNVIDLAPKEETPIERPYIRT